MIAAARLAALLLLLPVSAAVAADDLVFTGSLQQVSPGSIVVRLTDGRWIQPRLPKTGDLAAKAIAARFHLADQIQLTCKSIGPVYDKAADRYVYWELKQLRVLRTASPVELSAALAPRPWRDADDLLPHPSRPAAARPLETQPELERFRQVNLEYVSKLPNFVADEVARRSLMPTGAAAWRDLDTVESEISFQGDYTDRRQVRINGKPWNRPLLPVFFWSTGFGELKAVFDPACDTTITAAGREELRGRSLLAYRFHSPQDGCFSMLTNGPYDYNPPRAGRILIDEVTGHVLRLEEQTADLATGFQLWATSEVATWDDVNIASATHLVPVAYDFAFHFAGGQGRAVVEYRNHRHFEAAAKIAFATPFVTPAPNAAPSLDGVWLTQGYGYAFQIQGSNLKAFEVTAATCVPGFTATRDAAAAPGREATFRTKDGDLYFVRSGDPNDHKRLHNDGSASDMRIDRVPSLPAVCTHPTPDTPLDNFEVFTRTWAENYISFDLKHTDWAVVVAENRRKVTPQTRPSQLFDIFAAMIKPFGDAHTGIEAPKLKREFNGIRPGTDRVMHGDKDRFRTQGMRLLLAVTDKAYLRGPLRKFCNGKIEYGHINDSTGYLRIVSFSGYAKHGTFADGLKALEEALDVIFSDRALKSLVIDVRINFGGDDPYGLEIASRLATADYLAYNKEARSDPQDHNKWTPQDASVVHPSARPGFRGPVVELTGPVTISAGETFTQALMGRTPHVTRIGESTQGVFSDVLGRTLPNGWVFFLPNEVYRTAEGKAFDGDGIPPDIAVPVFADDDVKAGKDPAIAKALEILKKGN